MTKELESLERLAMPDELHIRECEKLGIGLTEDFDIVEQALLELKSIKESNPSEALNVLKATEKYTGIDLTVVKNALLKAQKLKSENSALLEENKDLYVELAFAEKQYKELVECVKQHKKVLDIIKEKDVDIYILNHCKTVDEYNSKIVHIIGEIRELTQDEFDILKRC